MVLKMFTVAEALSKAFRENPDKQSGQISITQVESYTQALENDSDGKAIFIGLADPGSAKNAASWQIRKITYSGFAVTDIQFADGDANFDNVWDDRSGLSYS